MSHSFESKENDTTRKKNKKDYSGSLENNREKLLREAQNAINGEMSINCSVHLTLLKTGLLCYYWLYKFS